MTAETISERQFAPCPMSKSGGFVMKNILVSQTIEFSGALGGGSAITCTAAAVQRLVNHVASPTTADDVFYMDITQSTGGKRSMYVINTMTATSGNNTAGRFRAESAGASKASGETYGVHAQGICNAGLHGAVVNALYGEAIAKPTSAGRAERAAFTAAATIPSSSRRTYPVSAFGTTESDSLLVISTVIGPECVCVAATRMFPLRTPISLSIRVRARCALCLPTKITSHETSTTCVVPLDRYIADASSGSCMPVLYRRTCGYPNRNCESCGVMSTVAAPASNDSAIDASSCTKQWKCDRTSAPGTEDRVHHTDQMWAGQTGLGIGVYDFPALLYAFRAGWHE